MRSDDTTYHRVWEWRTRYGTALGGNLGTGIGEGSQGVKCGRGEFCLAAQEIELEVDCDTTDHDDDVPDSVQHLFRHDYHHGHSDEIGNINNNNINNNTHYNGSVPLWNPHSPISTTPPGEEPGYFRQEIVGVGGVVKQKSKKRVSVGACVVQYQDERDSGHYLVREQNGEHRCWCGWCWRVIPSQREKDNALDLP